MPRLLTVGEFSRLTHLTVKALHHYHESGILEPARVDATTGYRYYSPAQATDAQLLRRLRQVRMPLADVRAVLAAPDAEVRRRAIAAHLDRLRAELAETAAAITSLQTLLADRAAGTDGIRTIEVLHRGVPDLHCLTLTTELDREAISGWSAEAFPRLFAAVAAAGVRPAGPLGALYGEEWFELGQGPVTAFLPVEGLRTAPPPLTATASGGVRPATVSGQDLAVTLHAGPYEDLDRTYAALGRYVLERGIHARGPAREAYLVGPADSTRPEDLRTEVGWPVRRAVAPAAVP